VSTKVRTLASDKHRKELGSLLRAVGENPSESEVAEMAIEVDIGTTGTFIFPSFLKMMTRCQPVPQLLRQEV
jgi:Ca2+-binding EF-hand superfamily protein